MLSLLYYTITCCLAPISNCIVWMIYGGGVTGCTKVHIRSRYVRRCNKHTYSQNQI